MSAYYFRIKYAEHIVPDYEGGEFSDLASAKEDASESLRELVGRAILSKGRPDLPLAIQIWDADGQFAAEVHIDAAIPQIALRSRER
ncbi:DUF6894 family protein [Rhizobium bangladeshense]|uniref:DUF6894 family protein n=1 Tax=Rhizobium bangladeshense TaxID=1138189 RepID=UPI0007E5745A|nr:hypothetical protein [Rhizobium bangladeshense]